MDDATIASRYGCATLPWVVCARLAFTVVRSRCTTLPSTDRRAASRRAWVFARSS